jgi:hypothetical protein
MRQQGQDKKEEIIMNKADERAFRQLYELLVTWSGPSSTGL